jgi:hypothetical protein
MATPLIERDLIENGSGRLESHTARIKPLASRQDVITLEHGRRHLSHL